MNILVNAAEEVVIIKLFNYVGNEIIEQDVAIIDVDYSLIRYLCKELQLKDITLNNYGYPVIKRDNDTLTTLHRFILEYYAKYDNKLDKLLKDKKLEINHKNKNKIDDRINNLEIVTHQDNIRHSKNLKYEAVMNSNKLKKIQQKNIRNKQQIIDKEYLKRISGLFYKSIKTGEINKKVVEHCYFVFKDVTRSKNYYDDLSTFSNSLGELSLQKFLPEFHTEFIHNLMQNKKQLIYKTVVKRNIALLNKYISKYPYIKAVLKKYKLLDKENKLNSIIFDFYRYVYEHNKYAVINGSILTILSIRNCTDIIGKKKAFIILYLLGILQRQEDMSQYKKTVYSYIKYIRVPSFITIIKLKDEHFKQINARAKKLLNLKWNSVRYFIVAQELGEATANAIYGNNIRCQKNYIYGLRAKEDIIQFLQNDQNVLKEGYITKQRLFHYVEDLNAFRQQNGAEYSRIYKSFYSFLSSLLIYNTQIKQILEQQKLIYITINKKIINNIEKYQKDKRYYFSRN